VAGEFLQKDNLTEGPLGVGGVLESVKVLLQSNDLFSLLVNGLPNDTISPLA
jgi:hypothetical protein